MKEFPEWPTLRQQIYEACAGFVSNHNLPTKRDLLLYLEHYHGEPVDHTAVEAELQKLIDAGLLIRNEQSDGPAKYPLSMDGWEHITEHASELTDIFEEIYTPREVVEWGDEWP